MFEGKRVEGPVGKYDAYRILAERYHWTPAQICRLDPDYIDELLISFRAEADVVAEKTRKAEAEKRKQERAARRNKSGRSRGEDVDLSEIA